MSKVTLTQELSADLQLFRKKMRVLREYYGLSRPKFAEELSIPPTTLKNYELGYRTPSLECLMNINTSRFAPHVAWLMDRTAPAVISDQSAPIPHQD
ncbi:helix-turn-helix domain-containing protein [Aeromonas salmonicida]|uniref:helix-turn-helix domain-containing protein n=1 Tax=Aeromonas salmonicida TaxID=645 RepID=UPI00232D8AD7|nr:helix-turn-helix transcriptional regulator [Aeromonas salmonicida]WCH25200.1 helix-turn-helix domain-containing protein [Aeromonas salmonicida]